MAKSDDHSSVFATGAGGVYFEVNVQTAFVVTMLVGGSLPTLLTGKAVEVAFQTRRFGFKTDDLLVKTHSHQGQHQLLAQMKQRIPLSESNKDFQEVMTAFWQDFTNKNLFNPSLDQLLLIESDLTLEEKRNAIVLLDWAKAKASADDFYLEVNRLANKTKWLDIFKKVLKKANGDQDIDREQLWQFLRCFYILEYDFGQDGSVSKASFLSLIKLAKNKTRNISEKEIWDTIFSYVARLNKDGGSITYEISQKESFHQYFNPDQLYSSYEAIKKLQSNEKVILGHLKDNIDGYHIARSDVKNLLSESIKSRKITIVIGEPGVGKSAIMKEVISDLTSDTVILVFRADQFNRPHLSQVFTELGINESLPNIFTCLAAIPNKIIVIDSFEKLLESEPDYAFGQLIHQLVSLKDVNVIASSRTYAVDLLVQKYALSDYLIVEVPTINDEETEQVIQIFPQLQPLLNNPQIAALLRSPKYLDFSIQFLRKTGSNVIQLSLTEFKDRLWQHIVENNTVTKGGMPAKRRKAFMEVALLRAKRMALYIEPEQADEEALEALKSDNVITQYEDDWVFAPSHDILEDWALVKYVGKQRETYTNPEVFYQQLGNEPAIRRAFRLWVEESLLQQPEAIFRLVRATLPLPTIERYWFDEVLIAIFRSSQSSAFFEEFEAQLLENNAELLKRIIHLIRTACKEKRKSSEDTFAILYPVGSGWSAVLEFVARHLEQLKSLRILTVGLLTDWSYTLHENRSISSMSEINSFTKILFSYLTEIENRVDAWKIEPLIDRIEVLIELAFLISEYAVEEVRTLLQKAMLNSDDIHERRPSSLYGKIRKKALLGLYTNKIAKVLPEEVIFIARAVWKLKPRPKPKIKHRVFGDDYEEDFGRYAFRQYRIYGLEDDSHASPAGIYKTPIFSLLRNNLKYGLDFVLEMVNHCTDHYVKYSQSKGIDLSQVSVRLNDGTLVKQWGSPELWQAYRETVVTSELFASILMSLEKYLLLLADHKSEISRRKLRMIFDYLLHRSESSAISSVLVSISMAYPEEVGEAMLPLLGVIKFYNWDVNRALCEHSALAPWDFELSFAQKERSKLNKLPHRSKYDRGLADFVIDLQFNVRVFNSEIFQILDQFWLVVPEEDVYGRKLLSEIDARKWKLGAYDEGRGSFTIEPTYEAAVKSLVEDYKPIQEAKNKAATISLLISKIYERTEAAIATYPFWQESYELYISQSSFDFIHDRPVQLAVIGLRDLNNHLLPEQRQWCFNFIKGAIDKHIESVRQHHDYSLTIPSLSPFDQKAALLSLPLLLKVSYNAEAKLEVTRLLIYVLVAYFSRHEMDPVLSVLRSELWETDTTIANQVWMGLIQFAHLRKNLTTHQSYFDNQTQRETAIKEQSFIESVAMGKADLTIDYSEISLGTWDTHFLSRAFLMLPFNTLEKQHLIFSRHFVTLYVKALDIDDQQEDVRNKEPLLFHDDILSIHDYLRDYFLTRHYADSIQMLEILISQAFWSLDNLVFKRDGSYKKVEWLLERIIYELDQIFHNKTEQQARSATFNFWQVWEGLYKISKDTGKLIFVNKLFVDIEWKESATHWQPLEGKKLFFKRIVDDFGNSHSYYFLKLLSSVGSQLLLPEGLHWLVTSLKKYTEFHPYLVSENAERLITRLYQGYTPVIKSDSTLLNDFLWLLNLMIDLGSSEAYITRENLITYKK